MYRIYGRTNCVWCDRAKDLLSDLNLDWVFLNIETDTKSRKEFKDLWPGATTVPKIMLVTSEPWEEKGETVTFEIIGGYKELYDWLRKRESVSE